MIGAGHGIRVGHLAVTGECQGAPDRQCEAHDGDPLPSLAGNVAEMTMTYQSGKVVDPKAVDTSNIMVRGGSFIHGKNDVSTGWTWMKRGLYDRELDTGFRLARNADTR